MTPLPHSDRRYLVEYLQATENEIAIDLVAYRNARLRPEDIGHFPRPTRWVAWAARLRPLMHTLSGMVAFFWRLTAGLPFHALQWFRLVNHHRSIEGRLAEARGYSEYGLGLSIRAKDIVGPPALQKSPPCWITLPWVLVEDGAPTSTLIDVFSLLSGSDLSKALRLSVASSAAMSRKARLSPWIAQSYTAFRWFCVRIALEKLDGHFLMAEHFDRWAVLVDQCISRKKLNPARRGYAKLSLIQHGIVGNDLKSTNPAHLVLARQLRSVDDLYAYDQAAARVFETDIIKSAAGKELIVQYYRPKISLESRIDKSSALVLFVGHPLCIDLHVAIMPLIGQQAGVVAFYKPHPANGMPALAHRQPWNIVHERNSFPDVDLLISYQSTLVEEYGEHGVPCVLHSINTGVEAAPVLAAEVLQKIHQLENLKKKVD